ncbi:MAG: 6-pyruvoyl-tetrahydropterin synthase-related protein [Syntrophomonas sp.]
MNSNTVNEKYDTVHSGRSYHWLFSKEPYLAVIFVSAALVYILWPLLSASNSLYPYTVDGMGHLTRVEYIADCLKHFDFPSWFPRWYNGSTVFQYYPPLVFAILVPIQMLTNNIMISFKFFAFFSMFMGAMGVWYICRRWIGPFVGIAAAVFFILQPFLLITLAIAGSTAQGPIYALTPWLLLSTLLFLEKQTAGRWIANCIITALLILSHPVQALPVSMALAILLLTLVFMRKISFPRFIFWGLSIAVGAALVSFWWVPGVTQFETPGVPYGIDTLTDTLYSADVAWFNPWQRLPRAYYFGLSMPLISLFALIGLKKVRTIKELPALSHFQTVDIYSLTVAIFFAVVFTLIVSCGDNTPLFKLVPLGQRLIPSRILSCSAALCAILFAILISAIIKQELLDFRRFSACLLIIILSVFIVWDTNPRNSQLDFGPYQDLKENLNLIPAHKEAFDTGRFTWFCALGSEISYLPLTYNLNMSDGWNIEGTPHMYTLWLHNTAIYAELNDYVLKNIFCWNVRSVLVNNKYDSLHDTLIESGFTRVKTDPEKSLFINNSPSSYFMVQNRDALLVGKAAPGMEMSFPWMVQGYSSSLEDYPEEYLQLFKLIYLAEPEVKDFAKLQNRIEKLASSGKTVIVEMGRAKTIPLFDTYPYWETIPQNSKLVPAKGSPFTEEILLAADPAGQAAAIGNLDGVWMEMLAGEKRVPAVGYKNINGARVYFIGLALGQHLDSSVKWSRGGQATSIDSQPIKAMLEKITNISQAQQSIMPPPFPVSNDKWGSDGFKFNYSSERATPVLISVTYTPRWQATIDNKPLNIYNLENLILTKLPAGKHQVSFKYGMTWVGRTGVGLSIISFILMLIVAFKLEQLGSLIRDTGQALLTKISDR